MRVVLLRATLSLVIEGTALIKKRTEGELLPKLGLVCLHHRRYFSLHSQTKGL